LTIDSPDELIRPARNFDVGSIPGTKAAKGRKHAEEGPEARAKKEKLEIERT